MSAKSVATTNWNDVSNSVYAQNLQQALISSGYFSPATAAVLSVATPMDAAGATESITGSKNSVTTPYGPALQSNAPAALNAIS
ncbi:hypothetical protein EOS_09220 [Caballeronia mineralivorans PML1(12)]|uniref:Uncharacterized protein n=1 Tax=Caballeronia mineralivorans PML1(12) TaxID=908627 RepID=A0A0J1D1H0_9BURK|nr:hypothetical protein [Caballeronia mineralivorans]KLU26506.1 hypothetical protein EOS_09220 [Caballeronia mineralivorans PML1(12)]